MATKQFESDGDPLAPHSLSPRALKTLLTAERAGDPFLAVRDSAGDLRVLRMGPPGKASTVGRRAEADISIPWDGEVSGLHAELQCRSGEWMIIDDGISTNGTYVQGKRVNGRQRLRDGDRIRVGRTVLVFRDGQPLPVPATAAAGERPTLQALTDMQHRVLVALCRPYTGGATYAAPASNQQIADEVFLSLDAVKMHLRTLFARFELSELPQNQKRAKLAELMLEHGIISPGDYV
jgi:FHA domain